MKLSWLWAGAANSNEWKESHFWNVQTIVLVVIIFHRLLCVDRTRSVSNNAAYLVIQRRNKLNLDSLELRAFISLLHSNFKTFQHFHIYFVLYIISRTIYSFVVASSSPSPSYVQQISCWNKKSRSVLFFYRVNLSTSTELRFMLVAVDNTNTIISRRVTYEVCCDFDERLLCIASGCSPIITRRE